MDALGKSNWIRAAMLVALIYLVAGLAFGALANTAASHRMVVTWRAAAYVVSAVAFAAHIAYEHSNLRDPPVRSALHAAIAVAFGAFGLAIAANIHSLRVASSHHRALALSLIIWPLLTGVPAFVVAVAATSGWRLARSGKRTD